MRNGKAPSSSSAALWLALCVAGAGFPMALAHAAQAAEGASPVVATPLLQIPQLDGPVRAMWSDGAGLLVIATPHSLHVVTQGSDAGPSTSYPLPAERHAATAAQTAGPPAAPPSPASVASEPWQLVGNGRGRYAVFALWRPDGLVVRRIGGRWESAHLPGVIAGSARGVPDGVRVTIDRRGIVYCATRRDGLFVGDSSGWFRVPYSEPDPNIVAVAAGPTGTVFLVDAGARLFSYANGSFAERPLSGLPPRPVAPWAHAYLGPRLNVLWVAGERERLYAIELDTGHVRQHLLRDPEAPASEPPPVLWLTGTQAGQSDEIAVATGPRGRLWLVVGGAVRPALDPVSRGPLEVGDAPVGLFPDARRVVVGSNPPSERPLLWELPALAAQGGDRESQPAQARSRPAKLPSEWQPWPMLRFSLGSSWRISPPPLPGASVELAKPVENSMFTFDLLAGGEFEYRRSHVRFKLRPELGYSYDASNLYGGHRFVTGLGLGYGRRWLFAAYAPWLVAGSNAGAPAAVGFRQTLGAYLFMSALGVELGHQLMPRPEGIVHELRFVATINPIPLVGLAALLIGFRHWR